PSRRWRSPTATEPEPQPAASARRAELNLTAGGRRCSARCPRGWIYPVSLFLSFFLFLKAACRRGAILRSSSVQTYVEIFVRFAASSNLDKDNSSTCISSTTLPKL
uniref:Uncharacterized protein n=1 Tax=Aegilops tauschii subsp. strangulata TaxID=200361 RepID=A0A452XBY9_AEGTS